MTLKEFEAAMGMTLEDAKGLVAEKRKQKSANAKPLEGADLKLAKMEALMRRKIPSEQIPVILASLNIQGTNPEEIDASITALVNSKIFNFGQEQGQGQGGQGQGQGQGADQGGQGQGGGNNANGAGNQGVGQQNGGKKIWTAAEVRALRLSGQPVTAEVLADIKAAEREGRVK